MSGSPRIVGEYIHERIHEWLPRIREIVTDPRMLAVTSEEELAGMRRQVREIERRLKAEGRLPDGYEPLPPE
jgi:hypothetical protein